VKVDTTANAFEAKVEGFVRAAIREQAPDSFDELVLHLPGVYPTDALLAVDRLGQKGEVDAVTLARLRRRGAIGQAASSPSNPLPVPHPLDFDWRFSASAVERLVSECEARASGTRSVLLGAPSVFWALRERGVVPALLLDANPCVIGVLAGTGDDLHDARLCDLRCDLLPNEDSAVVVVDPPWYREHERLFLWAAARLCRAGGAVLVSMPAEGTRPGVRAEREATFRFARQLGFEVERMEPGALGYVSPPFERNSLAAVGLGGMPAEWRRGDLVVLRLREHTDAARPVCAVETRWPEVTIGAVRVRIRATGAETPQAALDPRLREVVPGDVLDTVSRRDPRREAVPMWTSGNRVFAARSPRALVELVRSLAGGCDAEASIAAVAGRRLTTTERRNIRCAVAQVSAVIDAERDELAAMGWAA
jgi:hypothetical protein